MCPGNSHVLLKYLFGIYLCSMLVSLSNLSNLIQNGQFPIFSLFWWAFLFRDFCPGNSHVLLKYLFGIYLCSMLVSLSNLSNLIQNGQFPIFSLFWWAFLFSDFCPGNSHVLLKYLFGIYLCSMLVSLSNLSNLIQNGQFPIFSLFWWAFLLP